MLVAAYDDAAGITAAFNKNVLSVLNRELGADFDPDAFEHVALLGSRAGVDRDAAASLPARRPSGCPPSTSPPSSPRARRCGPRVSAKFRREGVARELAAAGFTLDRWWTDGQGRFGLSLARPA